MAAQMSLEQLQREMGAAVMQPLTPEEQMQPHDTTGRWNGRPMESIAGEFIRPNSRLTAFERLEIYNRQYWFRLQTAFHEDFPGLRAVVGGERFEILMNAYLTAHPSRSFTLRNLGHKLSDWLSQNPYYAGRRLALALDVVRVEWACIEAFDNAALPPLSLEEVAALGPQSRLGLQPHVQLLALSYPADDLVLDMHQKQKRESSEAGAKAETFDAEWKPLRLHKRPTWMAVHRADMSLYYKRLSREEFQTLAAIHQGDTVSDALEAGFMGSRASAASRLRLVQQWFTNWAELGWICKPVAESDTQKG
jgi:hypothetical protein